MPHAADGWTVERVRALPEDGKRYEVIDGELFVNPAPRLPHQDAAFQLCQHLDRYVRANGVGSVYLSPADIILDDQTLVQPDVFVSEPYEGRRPREWIEVKLLLAVEVISPSSQRADRIVKRRRYQRERVPEYWIVDLDSRMVTRWRPDDARPEEVDERLEWSPLPSQPALVLDLPAYFATVLDG